MGCTKSVGKAYKKTDTKVNQCKTNF